MNLLTSFIVLIERRLGGRRLLACLAALLIAVGPLFGARLATAQPPAAVKAHKIARDLHEGANTARMPKAKWLRNINGVRHVQAVVVTNGADPDMSALRSFVQNTGGSVHAVFPSMNAMTVQIRASLVQALAERDDVVSVSPNREIHRTASTLESITGAVTSDELLGEIFGRFCIGK